MIALVAEGLWLRKKQKVERSNGDKGDTGFPAVIARPCEVVLNNRVTSSDGDPPTPSGVHDVLGAVLELAYSLARQS